ncbi:MAG: hypothetical protein DHS80DRAFT_32580 [Piptocephalis tieghemiana]|nr:MAG: hypothetical protein DHS80DRAFT_32580 [Piptocephalis tieghemiana]
MGPDGQSDLEELVRGRRFSGCNRLGRVYPRSKLQDAGNSRHAANFKQLAATRRESRQGMLFEDHAVLGSMIRNGRQQHRQGIYFQRMCRVYRMMDRIKQANVEGLLGELLDVFRGTQETKVGEWHNVPNRTHLKVIVMRLRVIRRLMNLLIDQVLPQATVGGDLREDACVAASVAGTVGFVPLDAGALVR